MPRPDDGAALARWITDAHRRIDPLEVVPCGGTVWVLVAVADTATISYIHQHLGRSVEIAGWLRPTPAPLA